MVQTSKLKTGWDSERFLYSKQYSAERGVMQGRLLLHVNLLRWQKKLKFNDRVDITAIFIFVSLPCYIYFQ